jgi:hypothetical protein
VGYKAEQERRLAFVNGLKNSTVEIGQPVPQERISACSRRLICHSATSFLQNLINDMAGARP